MNDDQLTALAHEYAEECIAPYGFSRETYEELVEEKAESIAFAFRWLDRRFCLVEKESVRNEYQQAIEQDKHAHVRYYIESRAKLRLLESLFPEIKKEI